MVITSFPALKINKTGFVYRKIFEDRTTATSTAKSTESISSQMLGKSKYIV